MQSRSVFMYFVKSILQVTPYTQLIINDSKYKT